jgi:putative redox protein
MDDMQDEKKPDETMSGYKTGAAKKISGTLSWENDLIFTGRTNRGYEVEYDAKNEMGCSPTETLLLSVAGCMSIDIVSILTKMKCSIKTYKMNISSERNPEPPQYFTSINIFINIAGTGIKNSNLDRAISLSHEKYCSVYHTLRKDIKFNVDYKIEDE